MISEKNYKNYISLGYFCSVAMELERIGLRSASYPFDWLVTPEFSHVLEMIETGFSGFLDKDRLSLKQGTSKIYVNSATGFSFVHDFDDKRSLSEQLASVDDKFRRRIDRFYRDIEKPTMFIRYISDETYLPDGRSEDIGWIEDNYAHILDVIRSYNSENDIIWIANSSLSSEIIPDLYTVEKDENDTVARRPLDKNTELCKLLTEVYYPEREVNLDIYMHKQRKKKGIINRIFNRFTGN
ncbi:MAG: hypothetical protein IJ058_03725 [Lachnospiraceae bacterium]|nr:hypothetical protein [Lachnospiraceae bacterium]